MLQIKREIGSILPLLPLSHISCSKESENSMIELVTKEDIMRLTGYSKSQAQSLIRKAKADLVQNGFDWYRNKRVGRVPIKIIEDILGFELSQKNGIIHDVLQNAGLHDTGEQQ